MWELCQELGLPRERPKTPVGHQKPAAGDTKPPLPPRPRELCQELGLPPEEPVRRLPKPPVRRLPEPPQEQEPRSSGLDRDLSPSTRNYIAGRQEVKRGKRPQEYEE